MFDMLMSCFEHHFRSSSYLISLTRVTTRGHRAWGVVRVLLSLPILLQTEGRASYIEEATFCNTVALFDGKESME